MSSIFPPAVETPASPPQKRQRGHTLPKAPVISLDQPGLLRTAHVLALLGISDSTLERWIKCGRVPAPDGRHGRFPFWHTATIKAYLESL